MRGGARWSEERAHRGLASVEGLALRRAPARPCKRQRQPHNLRLQPPDPPFSLCVLLSVPYCLHTCDMLAHMRDMHYRKGLCVQPGSCLQHQKRRSPPDGLFLRPHWLQVLDICATSATASSFALRVKVSVYPEGRTSTWLMIATKFLAVLG